MKNDVWLKSVGKLSENPDMPEDWLISKAAEVNFFDGKQIEFWILQHDFKTDETFLKDANLAIQTFLYKNETDRFIITDQIYQNYKEIKDFWDSNPQIKSPSLKLNQKIDIWNYVYPGEIMVVRGDNQDRNIYLIISCECDWEEEHGLQLVFKNGQELTKVSTIDYSPT